MSMVLVSQNEATEPVWQFVQQITAIYTSLPDKLKTQDVYFGNKCYKYILMGDKSLTQHNNFGENKAERLIEIFRCKVHGLIIDFDESTDYFDFLFDIEDLKEYSEFLYLARLQKDLNICNAISIFLSQKKYSSVSADEEDFIFAMLNSNDLQLQGFALEAILNWDKFYSYNKLKNVTIQNKYIQKHLDEFLSRKA